MNRKHPIIRYLFALITILSVSHSLVGILETKASAGQNFIYLPIIYTPAAWEIVGQYWWDCCGAGSGQSIGIAPNGMVYVTWATQGGDYEIYIQRWNESMWEEVGVGSASGGGISNDDDQSWDPSIAIDQNGMPYVAWMNVKTVNGEDILDIYIRCWNGSNWEEVGIGSASGGGISNTGLAFTPSIAIAPDGTPYVVWSDWSVNWGTGNLEIYIRRWNGTMWEEVGEDSASGGGISNNTSGAGAPTIGIASDSTLYVTWADYSNEDAEIYIRQWDGISWEEAGVGSASGGGISSNVGASYVPVIAITPTGMPYVAWEDDSSGNYEIYIRRWDGSSWEEVGGGSASGGGISNNTGDSEWPSIAIAPDGTPYVTWSDYSLEPGEIYIRRWNGDFWEEVGESSASNGGLSNDSFASVMPTIAIDFNGVPYVAWESIFLYVPVPEIRILRWME